MDYIIIWISWLLFAVGSSLIAFVKGRDFYSWFLCGIFLGPLSFVVLFLPKVRKPDVSSPTLDNTQIRGMLPESIYLGWRSGKLSHREAATMIGGSPETFRPRDIWSTKRGLVSIIQRKFSE